MQSLIILSAMNGNERMIEEDKAGRKPLYRPREWNAEARAKKKQDKKQWYKTGGYDYVAFVPTTPYGEMKKIIKKEKASKRVRDIMKRSIKQSEQGQFEKEYCLMCQHEKCGNCYQSGIV